MSAIVSSDGLGESNLSFIFDRKESTETQFLTLLVGDRFNLVIKANGEKIGGLTVRQLADRPDLYVAWSAVLRKEERGKGLGQRMYLEMASRLPGTLVAGHKHSHLAAAMWKRLAERGCTVPVQMPYGVVPGLP